MRPFPIENAETTWDAAPPIAEDGHGPAWGNRLRDYEPGFWREVSALHREGNHDLAERAVARGNVRPIKPATPIGAMVAGLLTRRAG